MSLFESFPLGDSLQPISTASSLSAFILRSSLNVPQKNTNLIMQFNLPYNNYMIYVFTSGVYTTCLCSHF